jgi:hypothetical protein
MPYPVHVMSCRREQLVADDGAEEVSETWVLNSTLTRLIALEDSSTGLTFCSSGQIINLFKTPN